MKKVGRAWIAVELAAGITSLCLLIAVLPAIECLMALPADWSWVVALAASTNSGVGAIWLGRRALAIPAELVLGVPASGDGSVAGSFRRLPCPSCSFYHRTEWRKIVPVSGS